MRIRGNVGRHSAEGPLSPALNELVLIVSDSETLFHDASLYFTGPPFSTESGVVYVRTTSKVSLLVPRWSPCKNSRTFPSFVPRLPRSQDVAGWAEQVGGHDLSAAITRINPASRGQYRLRTRGTAVVALGGATGLLRDSCSGESTAHQREHSTHGRGCTNIRSGTTIEGRSGLRQGHQPWLLSVSRLLPKQGHVVQKAWQRGTSRTRLRKGQGTRILTLGQTAVNYVLVVGLSVCGKSGEHMNQEKPCRDCGITFANNPCE